MAMKACFWFVCPLDGDTNRYVAEGLQGQTGDYEHHDKECKDGVRRNLWECPNYDLVIRLKNDQQKLSLRFQVFRRRGLYGPIEQWSVSREGVSKSSPMHKPSDQRSRHRTLDTLAKTPGVKRGSQVPMPQQVG